MSHTSRIDIHVLRHIIRAETGGAGDSQMEIYVNITRPHRVSRGPDEIDKILALGNLMPFTDHIDTSARKLVSRAPIKKEIPKDPGIREFIPHIALVGTVLVVFMGLFVSFIVGFMKLADYLLGLFLPG